MGQWMGLDFLNEAILIAARTLCKCFFFHFSICATWCQVWMCFSNSCIFVFLSIGHATHPLWWQTWLNCQACQVPSVQSLCHVTPPAACQKLIVLIGKRQSCKKALRGDPPTQMKGLRFVLRQGLVGNRRIHWPAGQEGRTADCG